MTLKFVGTYNDRSWIKTGITSMDIACGNVNKNTGEVTLGVPTRIGIHMYGMYKCGKTHASISIASFLAKAMGKTVLHVPIDTFDDYVLNIMENCGLTTDPRIVMEGQDFESLNKMVHVGLGQGVVPGGAGEREDDNEDSGGAPWCHREPHFPRGDAFLT